MVENTKINLELLDKAIEWFADFIVYKQKGGSVDFYNGFMQVEEGYKREIHKAGHAAINSEAWDQDYIGSGKIIEHVIAGFNAKSEKGFNNIVDFHQITKFKTKATENLSLAEDTLYRLFKDDNPARALEDMCTIWGRWYPEWSYLLFLRDDTRFLPVKNSKDNHYDRFNKLGLDTSCLKSCTWDNLMEFTAIHEQIRNVLEERLDTEVSLLDAHSFVWTLVYAPNDLSSKYKDEVKKIENGVRFTDSIENRKKLDEIAPSIVNEIEDELASKDIKGKDKEAIVKVRVNQGIFRERLLCRYDKCCLCGVSNKSFLIASHIKPWNASEGNEKTDPNNGLLLCPNHDTLFDAGWITFDDEGNIIISDKMADVDRIFMNINAGMKISIREKNKPYLKYHREKIFMGECR